MKKYCIILFAALFLFLTFAQKADAQLVLVNLKVKIVKVERKNNRLQVRVHEKGNKDVQYVYFDSKTQFSQNNRRLTYDQAWRVFHKDQIIRVKGGYKMNLTVKARSVYM